MELLNNYLVSFCAKFTVKCNVSAEFALRKRMNGKIHDIFNACVYVFDSDINGKLNCTKMSNKS